MKNSAPQASNTNPNTKKDAKKSDEPKKNEAKAKNAKADAAPESKGKKPQPSGKSEKVIDPSPLRSRKGKLVWIDKTLIDAHPNNPRIGKRDDQVVEGIRATIEEEGGFPERYAPIVREIGARYQMIDGHGRKEAIDTLELVEQVPCWVVEMTDAEVLDWLGRGNLHEPMGALGLGVYSLAVVPEETVTHARVPGCRRRPGPAHKR